jgi:CheY-like chemotaxis protein
MGRKHIFIVNRDPAFLELLRTLLQDEEDYNVTTTNFVPETFDQIVALEPSLLIIDLSIGEQAGWHLLERLEDEAIARKIPVIVVSTDQRLLNQVKANQ